LGLIGGRFVRAATLAGFGRSTQSALVSVMGSGYPRARPAKPGACPAFRRAMART